MRTAFFVMLSLLSLAISTALGDTKIQQEWTVPNGGQVTLSTDEGEISVLGSDRSTVAFTLTSTDDQFKEHFNLQYGPSKDGVAIKIERREKRSLLGMFNFSSRNTKIELLVPRQVNVVMETSGGPISVAKLNGSVAADTSGGPIEVKEVEGKVVVETSGGGIDIARIKGSVKANTSGGPIEIADVSGTIDCETSGGGIEITGAGDRVNATTSGGPVSVTFVKGNDKGGALESSAGGIEVSIDSDVNLTINAETSAGRIQNELGGRLDDENEESDTLHGNLNKGGAKLSISTSAGSVRLRAL